MLQSCDDNSYTMMMTTTMFLVRFKLIEKLQLTETESTNTKKNIRKFVSAFTAVDTERRAD